MAAPRKRPVPSARMVQLLVDSKREALTTRGEVTARDFEEAWATAWAQMVAERGFPHATEHRRQWRVGLIATKSEMRAAFLELPTPFARLAESLTAAAGRLNYELRAEELPQVILGAIGAGYQIAGEHGGERTAA